MTLGRTFLLGLFLMIGPPAAVFFWHKGIEYQELQAIPPQRLPGNVVMVYSPSCGPCKTMLPIVHQMQAEGYRIRAANIRSEPALGQQWNIRALPTLIYFHDGQEQFRTVGGMSAQRLKDFCRGYQL
jgi:thioredoxin 1